MSGLRARKVRRCGRAGYPTRREVDARPELLAKHVPAEWVGRRELAGVLTAALALQAGGCGSDKKAGPTSRPAAAVVAPVSQHGQGRAAIGGDGGDWPMFLAEDEAMQIIREELDRAGLHMTQQRIPVEGVTIPRRQESWGTAPQEMAGPGTPLVADAGDPEKGVVVELISIGSQSDRSNSLLWGGPKYYALGGTASSSTVQEFDFREVAQYVSEQVRKSGKGVYFGAFYDPGVNVEWSYDWITDKEKTDEAGAAAESERLLRLQVRDFVEWLKGQGVI